MPRRLHATLTLATLAILAPSGLVGCGGAAANDAPKTYASSPRGIDDALADLDASEAEIASRFGDVAALRADAGRADGGHPLGYGAQGYPQQQQQQQPAPPPPPPAAPPEPFPGAAKPADAPKPASPTSAPPTEAPQAEASPAEDDEGDRCHVACRALGSMRRAADHVCRAAGSGDARCTRAQARVASASARVEASCEACDE